MQRRGPRPPWRSRRLRRALRGHRPAAPVPLPIVHAERSAYQEIVLTPAPVDRWRSRDVRLYLDGDLQFSSLDEHRYHETLAHPAMAGGRRRVLVLGGGLALREVLRYPDVEHVTDADSTDTAKLYTVELYGLVGRLLVDDGRMAVQAGSPFFAPWSYWSVVAAMEEAGLAAVPYHVDVPSFGDWGFVLAGRGSTPPALAIADDAPELRFLTPAVLDASRVFAPDRIPSDVEASTLLDPVILDYQRREWVGD